MGVETDAKFEALLEVYFGAAFVVDADGRYQEVLEGNSAGDLLYDDAEDLVGQRFHDVLPADTADRFLDVVQRALASGRPEVIEYDLEVPVGQRWFEASVTPVSSDDATEAAVLWAARDVTDRKQYKRALTGLHEAGTRLTASDSVEEVCEEAVTAAETILDFDQSIVALEDDGVLRAGATSEALPEDASAAIPVDEGLAGLTYRTGESRLVHDLDEAEEARSQSTYRSGLSLAIGDHGNFQAVATEPGAFDEADLELAELLVAQVDASLTQLRHEQELERRNERLDEFASIVSHDLKNPLNVAMGNLELAREDCDGEHLERVATAHERMEGLIEDLLLLAQTGEGVTDRERIQLAPFLRECWELVETCNATLEVETERTIRADRNRLSQCFGNLFANAVEHGSTSPDSRTRQDAVEHGSTSSGSPSSRQNAVEHGGDGVTVTVGELEDGLFVADDGPGIPQTDRNRLFEPGVSSADGGTGFGLHIVQTIAASHGWRVAASESADGGARFEITGIEFVPEE